MLQDENEQQNEEITVAEEVEGEITLEAGAADEEENEIVLSGQESEQVEPTPKDPKSFILKRFEKKNSKLQDENAELKAQLDAIANTKTEDVVLPPDEREFTDNNEFRQAKARYDRQVVESVVKSNIQQEQHGHRVAEQRQKQNDAVEKYADSAAGLKVSDFNEAQEKAFETLGDDFSNLIVQSLPGEKAAKLMYYFGKNPSKAADYRDRYIESPGITTFGLGELASQLTIKPKRSNAAAPETKTSGSSVVGGSEDWQKQLDKLDEGADLSNIAKNINARRAIKAKAKAAGFDVSTLK